MRSPEITTAVEQISSALDRRMERERNGEHQASWSVNAQEWVPAVIALYFAYGLASIAGLN